MTMKPDTLRAAHLDLILDNYCSQSSPTENLIDILTDAMHWCLLNDEGFEALLKTARMHIEFEVDIPSNQPPPLPLNGYQAEVHFPIGLRPLGKKLLALSEMTADFLRKHDHWLSWQDYAPLVEQKATLAAIARLLGAFNQDAYLADVVAKAEEYLAWMKARAELQAN